MSMITGRLARAMLPRSHARIAHVAWLVSVWSAVTLLPATGAAADTSSGREEQRATATVSAPRGLLHRAFPPMARVQRAIGRALSERAVSLGTERRASAIPGMVLLAAAFGALLAAGPGHGKIAVWFFVLSREARPRRAVAVGAVAGALQALSAIAAAWVLTVALGGTRAGALRAAGWLELASYVLVTLIGLAMLASAVSRASIPRARLGAVDWAFAIAAGLTPSAGVMAFVLFAVSRRVGGAGILAALAMALGVAVTLSAVALAGVVARATILRGAAVHARTAKWASRAIAVSGSAVIAGAGALFAWNAWIGLR